MRARGDRRRTLFQYLHAPSPWPCRQLNAHDVQEQLVRGGVTRGDWINQVSRIKGTARVRESPVESGASCPRSIRSIDVEQVRGALEVSTRRQERGAFDDVRAAPRNLVLSLLAALGYLPPTLIYGQLVVVRGVKKSRVYLRALRPLFILTSSVDAYLLGAEGRFRTQLRAQESSRRGQEGCDDGGEHC